MKIIFFLVFLISQLVSFGQNNPIYSKVHFMSDQSDLVATLNNNGFAIDHFQTTEAGIIAVVKTSLFQNIEELNISYEILVANMAKEYKEKNTIAKKNNFIKGPPESMMLENFDLGSYGGYHTYAETIESINLMKSLYPDKVKLLEIGTTYENRIIHAIKISDNASNDESGVEGVAYFDALTHAREPNSLFALLYYMWYLLENHETDREMKYIMENRELYFVPIVNPDGYEFNVAAGIGNGYWRKNRTPNVGTSCIGTDLNRNYGTRWGESSSPDPCEETYRGAEPFSELESQAVKGLVDRIKPKSALSNHAFSELIITALDGTSQLGDNIHREYATEFCPEHYAGYGQVGDILGASGTGATIEYIVDAHNCVAFTHEIGTFFYELSEEQIWDNAAATFPSFKFLSYSAGEYAALHDFTLIESKPVLEGFSNSLALRLVNKGHSGAAENVRVELSCDHPSILLNNNTYEFGRIEPRALSSNLGTPFSFDIVGELLPSEAVKFMVEVFQNGGFAYRDSFYIYAGQIEQLYSESAEENLDDWNSSSWKRSDVDSYNGDFCITDSPEDNYAPNAYQEIVMNTSVDLSGTQNPYLLFDGKWSLQPNMDYVTVRVSSNDGETWNFIPGASYTSTRHWSQEKIDLSDFKTSEKLKIGFLLTANSNRQSDGFYFDNLSIVDIKDPNFSSIKAYSQLEENSVSILSNPIDDKLIYTINSEDIGSYSISLHDSKGRLLLRENDIRDRTKELDLLNMSVGVYVMRIVSGEKYLSKKIIKN